MLCNAPDKTLISSFGDGRTAGQDVMIGSSHCSTAIY
jgi:hypothetical protein